MFPDMVKQGRVFLTTPPLYCWGDSVKNYGWCNKVDEIPKNVKNVHRFKGLGEMNSDQLEFFLVNPETRNLIQVDYPSDVDLFNKIVGSSAGRNQLMQDLGIIKDMSSDPNTFTENDVDKINYHRQNKIQEFTDDGKYVKQDAVEIVINGYTEYGKYVAMGRAYPNIKDGCKSAYKRAIYGMWKDGSKSIVKCAKLASYALPYHPHPSSISGVIIQLGDNGNKLKLMDTQGNWGDSSKGIAASAERYIGGALSDTAIKLLCNSVEYSRFIKGEIDEDEPEALPAFIPLCFINGLSGIPSGLPTLNIPTLNIQDMINYYIEILKHKSLEYRPKWYPNPNLEVDIVSPKEDWNNIMENGKGSIKVAPVMTIENGIITITSLPSSKNIEHVRKIVEKEIVLDKIDVRDESTSDTCIVIEKVPKKWCNMQEIYDRLYNRLQSSISYNMAFFDENYIYVPYSYDRVIKENLKFLIETHKNRIEKQLENLRNKLLILETIEMIKKNKDIIKIAELDSHQTIGFLVDKYKISEDIASKVIQKPISYLTKEHKEELVKLENDIKELENDKSDIYEFLIKKYKEIKRELNKKIGNKFKPTTFIK